MSDFAQSDSFMPPLSIEGEVKPVVTRRATPKPAPAPLAAYKSVSFVCRYNSGERLNGDKRLAVDLCARLSDGLNIPSRFFSNDDAYEKGKNGETLYIAVNCSLPVRLKPVSICINNDCNNYMENSDFYFEPFFLPFNQKFPEGARVCPINTLPSRITTQNIAEEVCAKPFHSEGKPVIAIMLRRPDLDDLSLAP